MKILLLSDKPPWPGDSGGALATQSMIRDIVEAGYELDTLYLCTPKHNGNISDIPPEIKGKFRVTEVNHKPSNSIYKAFANLLFSYRPYNIERFKSDKVEQALRQLLSSSEYDIVQFEGLPMVNYLKAVSENSRARLVMRSHNVEYEIWDGLSYEAKNPLKRAYFRILTNRIEKAEQNMVRNIDGMIAISARDLEKFRTMGLNKIATTVYPALNSYDKNISIKGETKPLIGFIGSLDWIPNLYGLEWFLSFVWPEVRKQVPGCRFLVGGRNPGRSILRRIERAGAEYLGNPSSSTDFIASIPLLVVPLFSGSGIRIKIIESLLNGTMVVTTPKGIEGMPGDIASMIPSSDQPSIMAELITESLLKSSRDYEYYRILKESVGRVFNRTASGEKLTGFYNSLIHDN